MLLSYSMKGFKSIRNEVKIDLKSTNYKILSKSNVSNTGILKGALFIGEIGSGKSTMVSSIKFLLDLLFTNNDIDLRNFFCLTNSEEKVINLNFNFYLRSSTINYYITIEYAKPLHIVEKLFINNELVIERLGNDAKFILDSTTITAKEIESNKLFLKDLYDRNLLNGNKILFEFIKFLKESAYINSNDNKFISYNEKQSMNIQQYLFDQIDEMNQFFNSVEIPLKLILKRDNDKLSIRVKHEEEAVALPLALESNSIKNLIKLLPSYLNCIKKGGIYIIDDFNEFHPNLESKLISYFEENTKNGQILITTSKTAVLNENVFRADQLYSVYKAGNNTKCFRFSIKQPRELQNMEKMYFNGIFKD